MTSPIPVRYLGRRSRAAAARVWTSSDDSPSAIALQPIAALYGAVMRARRRAYSRGTLESVRVSVPVISVGNLAVGGTGKTPVTRWLVEQLQSRGQRPAVLHGGYAGDEPALHRSWHADVPVYAGKDRVATAERAIREGATALVLDDGLQHLRLARSLDIALVAADTWNAPKRLLPAGAWREPLETLRDVELIAVTRKAASREVAEHVAAELRDFTHGHSPSIIALTLDDVVRAGTPGVRPPGPVVGLCSIADPIAFGEQLRQNGFDVSELLAFGDHHDYTADDLVTVRGLAGGRAVVATEKDAVKIGALDATFEMRIARQRVVVESGLEEINAALDAVLIR